MTVKFSDQGWETAFESYIPDQFTLYNDPDWNLIYTVFLTLITIKHQSHFDVQQPFGILQNILTNARQVIQSDNFSVSRPLYYIEP